MKITFLGATGIVTGSCFMLEFSGKKILVECGMFQGLDEVVALNYNDFKFNPSEIHCVLLTHAHADHSGLIPKLFKHGFRGKVYTTKPTRELCKIMYEDSANIQEKNARDAEYLDYGAGIQEPLFDEFDAKKAISKFKDIDYGKMYDICENLRIRFNDAGHILGAAIIEVFLTENGKETKIVFSGDIGQKDTPLVNPTSIIKNADYLVVESTYGDRLHKKVNDKNELLLEVIEESLTRGGKIFIPVFAIQRTQEMLYRFKKLHLEGKLPDLDIYLDSPLAIEATGIFKKNTKFFDPKVQDMKEPFSFKKVRFTKSRKESIMLNSIRKSSIIMAGSGMCTGGRILHHLRNNIWDEKNTFLFIGYQAEETLGREIIQGAKKIEVFDENVPIKSKIEFIDCFSGHADYEGLIEWIDKFEEKPKKIFVVHGEKKSSDAFAEKLKNKGYNVHVPLFEEGVEL